MKTFQRINLCRFQTFWHKYVIVQFPIVRWGKHKIKPVFYNQSCFTSILEQNHPKLIFEKNKTIKTLKRYKMRPVFFSVDQSCFTSRLEQNHPRLMRPGKVGRNLFLPFSLKLSKIWKEPFLAISTQAFQIFSPFPLNLSKIKTNLWWKKPQNQVLYLPFSLGTTLKFYKLKTHPRLSYSKWGEADSFLPFSLGQAIFQPFQNKKKNKKESIRKQKLQAEQANCG